MKIDKHITVAIFRKFKDGQVIALFPYEKETKHYIVSYMHIGQHSGADYGHVVSMTKLATEEEYAPLKKELESVGYNLKTAKKMNSRNPKS